MKWRTLKQKMFKQTSFISIKVFLNRLHKISETLALHFLKIYTLNHKTRTQDPKHRTSLAKAKTSFKSILQCFLNYCIHTLYLRLI